MSFFKKIKGLFTRGEKTTLQRQARAGIIVLSVLLVGLIVYFAFIAPALRKSSAYVPELFEGEELYNGNTILMVKQLTRYDVASIEVKNGSDHYTLVARDMENSTYRTFDILGAEDVPLDDTDGDSSKNNVSALVTHATMLVTNAPSLGKQDRVNDHATGSDLAAYGLDEASDPSYVVVTKNDGSSYKIVIGSKQPMDDGYYAMVDGRRNETNDGSYYIVYTLTNYVASDLVEKGSVDLVSNYVLPVFGS